MLGESPCILRSFYIKLSNQSNGFIVLQPTRLHLYKYITRDKKNRHIRIQCLNIIYVLNRDRI